MFVIGVVFFHMRLKFAIKLASKYAQNMLVLELFYANLTATQVDNGLLNQYFYLISKFSKSGIINCLKNVKFLFMSGVVKILKLQYLAQLPGNKQ